MKAGTKMTLSIFIGVCVLLSCGAAAFTTSVIKERQTDELRAYIKTLEDDRARLIRENVLLKANKAAIEQPIVVAAENAADEEIAQAETAGENPAAVPETETVAEMPVQANANANERLPDLPTNFYPAEYMTTITNTRSEQYKLQQQCHTETGTGLRYYYDGAEEYYTAALGGAYGDTIGDAWRVTLRCGSVFNVMRGDFKHALPAEPDDFGDICRNYDKELCMCVLEFIADRTAMPESIIDAGGFHVLDFFGGLRGDGGDIVKMEYLGRRWEP